MRDTLKAAEPNQPTGTDGAGNTGPASGRAAAEMTGAERARFEALRSAMYHDMCMARLLRWHRGLQFATVVLGSGAVAGLATAEPAVAIAAGLLVTAIGAAQLVWDFGVAAHRHEMLRKACFGLVADLDQGGDPVAITARLTTIFADEPPVDDRLNARAHNKAGRTLFGDSFTRA